MAQLHQISQMWFSNLIPFALNSWATINNFLSLQPSFFCSWAMTSDVISIVSWLVGAFPRVTLSGFPPCSTVNLIWLPNSPLFSFTMFLRPSDNICSCPVVDSCEVKSAIFFFALFGVQLCEIPRPVSCLQLKQILFGIFFLEGVSSFSP